MKKLVSGWVPAVILMVAYAIFELYVSFQKNAEIVKSNSENVQLQNQPDIKNEPKSGLLNNSVPEKSDEISTNLSNSPEVSTSQGLSASPELESQVLNKFMELGYSAIDAQLIINSINNEFKFLDENREEDAILTGIKKAVKELKLSEDRTAALYDAHSLAMEESGNFIDFHDWKSCVERRVAKNEKAKCLEPISEKYLKDFEQLVPNRRIGTLAMRKYESVFLIAADQSQKECKISEDVSFRLFYFNLADCEHNPEFKRL